MKMEIVEESNKIFTAVSSTGVHFRIIHEACENDMIKDPSPVTPV